MRFCPFCSAENADELAACQACGRRLPPLPPRRARNAPPTGIQLPPRSTAAGGAPAPPQRKSGQTVPPPLPEPTGAFGQHAAASGQMPFQPPPSPSLSPSDDATRRSLAHAISPGPAAVRREPLPQEPRTNEEPTRRRGDGSQAIPRVTGPRAAQPASAPAANTQTQTLFPPREVFPSGENTDVQPQPIEIDPASSGLVDGPTMQYPGRAPSPSPAELDDPDAATKLNTIGARSSASGSVSVPPPTPPPTPTSVRAQPAPQRLTEADRSIPVGAKPRPESPHAEGIPQGGTRLPLQPAPLTPPSMPVQRGERVEETQPTPPPQPHIAPIAPIIPLDIRAARAHTPTGVEPPATRIQRPDQLADRPFAPPKVLPIPEIPEPGLVNAARYAARFARARHQRRGAIKILGVEIKQDTEALDHVLGALGREAREVGVDGRVFSAENSAITAAEVRVQALHREHTEVDARKAEEGSKFVDVERERNTKLAEAERTVEEAQRELATHEAQRRGLRDKRKEIERRQKAYLKAAEDHNRQAGGAQMGDQRSELRRAAEGHSREAAALEPDRQELDRRIAALERPVGESTAKLDAAKAELDAAKRSLNDAREGHTHRLAELDSESKRKAREIALAEGEIARRLVTLGTLVNLNRIEDTRFAELYQRIDRLRGAITARTTEIEKLTAERDAFDRGTLVRGVVVIGAAVVAFIALVVILRAIL